MKRSCSNWRQQPTATYLRLDNVEDALITMTQQLDIAEKKAMNDAEFIDYISYFQWFAGAAMGLLLVELLLAERRRGRLAAERAPNGDDRWRSVC